MEKKFGTFSGVFLPTFLTIIGVIFYLRLAWVVGNSGLAGALIIIVVAHLITISTALSMTSITTNMKVEGGGAYFLISRSLGKEIGGSIGIPLYLSQVLSVSLYVLGFIESVQMIFPSVNLKLIAICVAIILGLISIIGADLAIKAQYIVFSFICLSLGTILLSSKFGIASPVLSGSFEQAGFWETFAIFFPAVTGILAGVSMSGDLKDAKSSIPKGTLSAIAVTFIIYVLMTLWLAFNIEGHELLTNPKVLLNYTKIPLFIILGIWAATLSSALGSLVAAPRTMQALALDNVLPKIFSKGSGTNNEPRLASVFSFLIAFIFIITGNLNSVAPVITMFFLNTYGIVNLVAGLESLVNNPSYRPKFKTPVLVSFFGFMGSYAVMFLISPIATFISVTAIIVLYLYLKKKKIEKTWGDLRKGLWASIARYALIKLRFEKSDAKNWKPDVMVFSGQPSSREDLLYMANLLCKGNGIITLVNYVLGEIKDMLPMRDEQEDILSEYILENDIIAFPEVVIADDVKNAIINAIQANGIGYMKPNSVLIGLSKDSNKIENYVEALRGVLSLGKNLLLFNMNHVKKFGNRQRIDVWWGGLENNGWLMMNLAHIISKNYMWKNAEIRYLSVARREDEVERRKKDIEEILTESRISGKVEVICSQESFKTILNETSTDSDLLILGLADPSNVDSKSYLDNLSSFSPDLPSTLFVKASKKMKGV
jgi:amino acid transporter